MSARIAASTTSETKDDPKAWAALVNLTKVLNETPLDRLEAALTPILDVDETLRFLALENVFVNSDGYWVRASDYNLYLDPAGRFHVLPHDVNEAFPSGTGRGGFGGPPPGGFGGPPPGAAVHRQAPQAGLTPADQVGQAADAGDAGAA